MRYLITGVPRSGTSLTARVLQACGLDFGAVNPLHERSEVRDGVVKPFLKVAGFDPFCRSPLPTLDGLPLDTPFRDNVLAALDGADAYKDPKAILMWPVWRAAFPEARWVVVRRDRRAIAASCQRTSWMWGQLEPHKREPWLETHLTRLEEVQAVCDPNVVEPINPDGSTNVLQLQALVRALGLTWDDEAVFAAMEVKSP